MAFEDTYKKNVIVTKTISNFLILSGLFFLFFSLGPTLKVELWYKFSQIRGVRYSLEGEGRGEDFSPFGYLLSKYPPIHVEPVSRESAIVIEKIGVNAPIVAEVNVANRREYLTALKLGVAQAKGSAQAGEVGNTYLFAHSALDFWNFGPYATVFTLLGNLEIGDRIVIFYHRERYDYAVTNKEIVKGFNTEPLSRTYHEPVLTIQTCDPPGTALNRLIVTAKLVKVGY